MSSKNNINVDHYNTKDRGRQGDGVVYDEYTRLRNQLKRRRGLSAKRLLARKRALRAARQTESRSVRPQHSTRISPGMSGFSNTTSAVGS